MANQKLSNLILPGSETVYEIDAVYFGGRTAAEWQASTMSFKGTVTADSNTETTATLYLVHVKDLFYKVSPDLNPVVGDSYKVIFKDATKNVMMYASSSDVSKGSFQISHGDMIIYNADGLWVDIPSGNDENVGTVTNITAGDGLTGGNIDTSGTISVDWTKTAKLAHSHTVTGTAAAQSATFTGSKAEITVPYKAEGNITVTSEDKTSGYNYLPKGTISGITVPTSATVSTPTFTGTSEDINIDYKPTGSVSVSATKKSGGNYTPEGSISAPTFTGTKAEIGLEYEKTTSLSTETYTPAGNLTDLEFTGSEATITLNYRKVTGVKDKTYTPEGTIKNAKFEGTPADITSTVTVTGENTAPTVTVDDINFAHKVTVTKGTKTIPVSANVNITAPSITVTPATETVVKSITVTPGTDCSMTPCSFEQKYGTSAGLPAQTLQLSFTAGVFTPGTLPTITHDTATVLKTVSAALSEAPSGSFTTNATVEDYVTNVTVANHTDEITATATAPVWTQRTGTAAASYTPEGTISADFEGKEANITPELDFVENSPISTTYTPAGTVSGKFVGTQSTHTHTITHTPTAISTEYTPAGTISAPTFSGTAVDITASFNGNNATLTTNYTPKGTISTPTATFSTETVTPVFTGTGADIKATFAGSNQTSTVEYTPAGTVATTASAVTGSTATSVNEA